MFLKCRICSALPLGQFFSFVLIREGPEVSSVFLGSVGQVGAGQTKTGVIWVTNCTRARLKQRLDNGSGQRSELTWNLGSTYRTSL